MITETEHDDRSTSQSEDSDLSDADEKLYKNLLKNDIETSDTDDDDYVNEQNGDDISDTDSQDSVATDDLSDDDAKKWPNEMDKNSQAKIYISTDQYDSNYSADTSTLTATSVDQPNKGKTKTSN